MELVFEAAGCATMLREIREMEKERVKDEASLNAFLMRADVVKEATDG